MDDPDRFHECFDHILNHPTLLNLSSAIEETEITLRVLNFEELLALKLPPREMMLDPILRQRDVVMVYSWRGVGKTMLGSNMAYAIAAGSTVLDWSAPKARQVFYIDGKLQLEAVQEHLALIISAQRKEPPAIHFLRFLTYDAQPLRVGLPALAMRAGSKMQLPKLPQTLRWLFSIRSRHCSGPVTKMQPGTFIWRRNSR